MTRPEFTNAGTMPLFPSGCRQRIQPTLNTAEVGMWSWLTQPPGKARWANGRWRVMLIPPAAAMGRTSYLQLPLPTRLMTRRSWKAGIRVARFAAGGAGLDIAHVLRSLSLALALATVLPDYYRTHLRPSSISRAPFLQTVHSRAAAGVALHPNGAFRTGR